MTTDRLPAQPRLLRVAGSHPPGRHLLRQPWSTSNAFVSFRHGQPPGVVGGTVMRFQASQIIPGQAACETQCRIRG